MEFEWDNIKSNGCFTERGFDFLYVTKAFEDPQGYLVRDHRWDYGEDRFRLLARIEGRIFCVVYTVRGSVIRIISARKANHRETREYENRTREN
jgi:uncharacterized DUF497 family protein